jgi:hypothetical protein
MPQVFTPITSGMYQKGAIQEGVISKEGKKPNQRTKHGPTNITTEDQTQQEAHSMKEKMGQASLGAGAPGARPCPPLCYLGPPRCGGLVIIGPSGVGIDLGIFLHKPTRQPLYKSGRGRLTTHTSHSHLSSLSPLSRLELV